MNKFLLLVCIIIAVYTIGSVFFNNYKNLGFILKIVKRFSLKMFFEVLVITTITIASAVLMLIFVPWTSLGFSSYISSDGESTNIMLTPFIESQHTDYIIINVIGFLFVIAFIVAMPFLANAEEELFRRGKTNFKDVFSSSVSFGLIHLIMGIPVAVAIALIIPGFFFAYTYNRKFKYLRKEFIEDLEIDSNLFDIVLSSNSLLPEIRKWQDDAVLESTASHTLYNWTIIFIGLLVILIL